MLIYLVLIGTLYLQEYYAHNWFSSYCYTPCTGWQSSFIHEQTCWHDSSELKLLPFPWQPPYMNSSHRSVFGLYPYFVMSALHGPCSSGKRHCGPTPADTSYVKTQHRTTKNKQTVLPFIFAQRRRGLLVETQFRVVTSFGNYAVLDYWACFI